MNSREIADRVHARDCACDAGNNKACAEVRGSVRKHIEAIRLSAYADGIVAGKSGTHESVAMLRASAKELSHRRGDGISGD